MVEVIKRDNQMDFIERSHFRSLVFQNGLKRRFDESLEIY